MNHSIQQLQEQLTCLETICKGPNLIVFYIKQ